MSKKTVIFNKEFANRKVGESFTCDSQLASQLVNIDKVADYEGEVNEKTVSKPKTSKKVADLK